ncbi:MAG: hypothetical protein AAF709_22055 [Pseudomonadota bacterium]
MDEPLGGAHRDPNTAIEAVGAAIQAAIEGLSTTEPSALKSARAQRFLDIGRTLDS